LRQAAIAASETYHSLLGSLEAAHIRHDTDITFRIQQQAVTALGNRNDAIRVLSEHESMHSRNRKSTRAAAVCAG
jgi:hypothetical protein